MKTPRFLLLAAVLLAATAAQADPKPGQRCDSEWIDKQVSWVTGGAGRTITDERVETVADTLKLKFGHAKTCDKGTWRLLAAEEPISGEAALDPKTRQPVGGAGLRWRAKAAAELWAQGGVVDHLKLTQAVVDLYKVVDAKGAAVLAAADEVLEAAKGLGLADAKPAEKTLAELLGGASGGAHGAAKHLVVAVHEPGKAVAASVAPGQLGASYRKIVDDGGALGSSVVKFRVAVLALGVELARLASSDAIIKKRLAREGLKDLIAGVPAGFAPTAATAANALAEEKYKAGLTALVGAAPASGLGDAGLKADAALDPLDLGLRNLISVRSAEIDKIVAGAKKRLEGKTIAQIESSARMAESRTAANIAPNSLAAATMDRLAGSQDYASLAAAFEARKARPDGDLWVKSAEGQRAQGSLDSMRAAAQSAAVEDVAGKKTVVVTVNGKKRMLGNVPANMDDAATREYAADQVADLILRGEKDSGKLAAALAAVKGENPADAPVSGDLAGKVPPPPEIPKSDWAKAMDSKDASCGSPADLGKSEMERIAARKAERAADIADGASKGRRALQKALNDSDEAIKKDCKEKESAIATAYLNPDIKDQAEERRTRVAALREDCNKRIAAARQAIWAKPEHANLLDSQTAGARRDEALAQADREIAALYDSGIADALAELERKYKTKGTAHRLHVERATGYKDQYYDLERVTRYFDVNWRAGDADAKGRYADCRKTFGYVEGKSPGARLLNPRADRVEGVQGGKSVDLDCGVRAGLVAHMGSYKGQVAVEGGAVPEPSDLAGSENVDDVLRSRRSPPKK